MNKTKSQAILSYLTNCPIITTEQAASFFLNTGSPMKRASEHLRQLEEQKLVEGKRRAMGETKVWRLTKRGRESNGISRNPVSFSSGKLDHWIHLASCYRELSKHGLLRVWTAEPRYLFDYGNTRVPYSPDAFLIITVQGKTYPLFLEVQDSPLTSKRWGEKWSIATHFFDSGAYAKASFQTIPNRIIKPRILVVSTQQPETIQGGSRLPLLITEDIKKPLPL